MTIRQQIRPLVLVLVACMGGGCALWDDGTAKKTSSTGLIATPPTYYSTAKARYLGTTYKDNLDRLAERIIRNSSTSELKFANNISSVGGIGFFTHSATKTADERFLEVVLATPETFTTKGEYSEKVSRLFARYGQELLSILAGDTQIYQDKELTGYGLNFTWNNALSDGPGNRTSMARAIIYFQKEKVASFLRRGLAQSDLLRDAVIFAVEEDGPLNLVSFQARETKPDFRPAIREDNLAAGAPETKPVAPPVLSEAAKLPDKKNEVKLDTVKKDEIVSQDAKPRPAENKPPVTVKAPVAAQPTPSPRPAGDVNLAADKSSPVKRDAAEKLAMAKPSTNMYSNAIVGVTQSEPVVIPEPTAILAGERSDQIENKVGDLRPPNPLPAVAAPRHEDASAVKPASDSKSDSKKVASKPGAETATKPAASKTQEAARTPAKLPAAPAGEDSVVARVPSVTKLDGREMVIEPAALPPQATSSAIETPAAPASAIKERDDATPVTKVAAPRQAKPVESQAYVAAEQQSPSIVASPAEKTRLPPSEVEPLAKPTTAIPITESAKRSEVTKPDVKTGSKATNPLPGGSDLRKSEPVPQTSVPYAPTAPTTADAVVAPKEPALGRAEKTEPTIPRKIPTAAPVSVAKTESPQTLKPTSISAVVPAVPEKAVETTAPEQVALLRKPAEAVIEQKPLARPVAPKSLEGFIIQIAFNDKEKAQSWADKMQQRGYAISVTEAGVEGSLRVRLGNFPARDDAERQLRNFKQEGMNGIIINLPQAFRPEARSSSVP